MSNKKETSSPALKRSWFQEMKAEFAKITWPTKDTLIRESIVVLLSSIALGFLIAGIDWAWEFVMKFIVG